MNRISDSSLSEHHRIHCLSALLQTVNGTLGWRKPRAETRSHKKNLKSFTINVILAMFLDGV